jgi:hypothetical protein
MREQTRSEQLRSRAATARFPSCSRRKIFVLFAKANRLVAVQSRFDHDTERDREIDTVKIEIDPPCDPEIEYDSDTCVPPFTAASSSSCSGSTVSRFKINFRFIPIPPSWIRTSAMPARVLAMSAGCGAHPVDRR